MTEHPYKSAPDRAFWSRTVGDGVREPLIATDGTPLIKLDDRIMSAGSCFAANIIPYLERSGLHYLRTERRHPDFGHVPADKFSYELFTAAYGNIYTARHLLQLLRRCRGRFTPAEDRWHTSSGIVDPFRPGRLYRATFDREFDALTQQHLQRTLEAFSQCTVFIFTFGLTEAWESVRDGAVFPSCPGTVAGEFDPASHRFVNFSYEEVAEDFASFVRELKEINPAVRIIVTVSPVPLVATASADHVLVASSHSKARLILAAHSVAEAFPEVTYFPAYEIVTTGGYFEADRRNVTQDGIDSVMEKLLMFCETSVPVQQKRQSAAGALSAAIVEAECEEAMADR